MRIASPPPIEYEHRKEHSMDTIHIKDIKKLGFAEKRDIELKNFSRKLAGLPTIQIALKRCAACNALFESAGNVTCGCHSQKGRAI